MLSYHKKVILCAYYERLQVNPINADLEGEHEQLLQFLYSCPIGLVEIAADGAIAMMNPFAMKLLLPITRTPMTTNFFAIMEPYAPELRNMADAFIGSWGAVCENHQIFVSPGMKEGDSEAHVLSCTLVRLKGQRFMATIEDISTQIAQQRRLAQAEAWFASLLDDVDSFAVVSLDAQGKIDGVNRSVLLQTGLSESAMLGHTLDVFNIPDLPPGSLTTTEQISLARRDGWHLTEIWQNCVGGKPYWCQRLIAVRSVDEGTNGGEVLGYTVVLREVKQPSSDLGKLKQMLTQDYLTGAYSRSYFFKAADRECTRARRHGQPLALISLDLDNFKVVNDSYGHGAGDEVLKSISASCMGLLRQSDTFARLGGEEFVVLLPMTNAQSAEQLAERLRLIIATTPINVLGAVLHVTASFGCANMSAQLRSITELLAAADQALYAAKTAGRDRVVQSNPALA